jgi:hypothetical protein
MLVLLVHEPSSQPRFGGGSLFRYGLGGQIEGSRGVEIERQKIGDGGKITIVRGLGVRMCDWQCVSVSADILKRDMWSTRLQEPKYSHDMVKLSWEDAPEAVTCHETRRK